MYASQKLDVEQLDKLTCHSGASTPLWLSMACEELRVFGDFRMLSSKIDALPLELGGLFQDILKRLMKEDETNCMEKVRFNVVNYSLYIWTNYTLF